MRCKAKGNGSWIQETIGTEEGSAGAGLHAAEQEKRARAVAAGRSDPRDGDTGTKVGRAMGLMDRSNQVQGSMGTKVIPVLDLMDRSDPLRVGAGTKADPVDRSVPKGAGAGRRCAPVVDQADHQNDQSHGNIGTKVDLVLDPVDQNGPIRAVAGTKAGLVADQADHQIAHGVGVVAHG